MIERCAFCGHKHLKAKNTRYIHQQGEELLIMGNVPCLECEFCHEPYFEARVLKAIEAEHLAITNQQKTPEWVKQVAVVNGQNN